MARNVLSHGRYFSRTKEAWRQIKHRSYNELLPIAPALSLLH